MSRRPVLLVLAGVNGAGKSSIGGHLLTRAGLSWFNPDDFARHLMAQTSCDQVQANTHAWQEGVRRLDEALANGLSHAFETTLGGRTVTAKILEATRSHDVEMWFCGLATPELHLARVQARVRAGGHDIPEAQILARWRRAPENLLGLMPHLAYLRVYDNSVDVAAGEAIPDPLLVLEMESGQVRWPETGDLDALQRTPDWAKALVEGAMQVHSEQR